jgi:hypothetical protein
MKISQKRKISRYCPLTVLYETKLALISACDNAFA